jgi:hypothetical protein
MKGLIIGLLERFTRFEPIVGIKKATGSIENMKLARTRIKIEYLEMKSKLVQTAAKCNSINLYSRSFAGGNFITSIDKLSKLQESLDPTSDTLKYDEILSKINNYLENIIEKIDDVDATSRDSRTIRSQNTTITISLGREYIERLLMRQFGYNIVF